MPRPVVRPGLKILRRDPTTLQLGLDWPGLAAIHDTPAIGAVLSAVDGFRDVEGIVLAAAESGPERDECAQAVELLTRLGVLVDRPRTERVGPGRAEVPDAAWQAWWLLAGPDRGGDDIAVRRRRFRVAVRGTGVVADRVRDLVGVAGLGSGTAEPGDHDLLVVASDGMPDRIDSDALMHDSGAHLWVHVRDLVGVVGPLVLPGHTACLRCVDLARSERDGVWSTLIAAVSARPAGTEPCDPILATVVAAWALNEVAVWAGGHPPPSHGSVVEIPLGLGPVTTDRYTLHPECGCGWSAWRDTMGA